MFKFMTVQVKLSTTLRKYIPDYNPEQGLSIDLKEFISITALAKQLGLPLEEIKFVMLNGRCQPMDTILKADDRVAFFPAVGGG